MFTSYMAHWRKRESRSGICRRQLRTTVLWLQIAFPVRHVGEGTGRGICGDAGVVFEHAVNSTSCGMVKSGGRPYAPSNEGGG